MKKALILVLAWLCGACATREEMAEELTRELRLAGHNLVGGPWDINDDKGLAGMLGHKAMWGWRDKDNKLLGWSDKDGKLLGWHNKYGKLLSFYDKDGKWIGWYDKDGKWLGCHDKLEFDKDRAFTLDTIADIQDLAQKLRSGKCQYSYSLILYKDFSQLIKSGFKKVSCLYLDPRDFFFSLEQAPEYFGCWTLNEAFFTASGSPKKMAEFQKQFDESRILQIVREEHKAEVTRLEAIITTMGQQIVTTRNESAVLKELFSVACKKADADKEELHLLVQQLGGFISRQTDTIQGMQQMIKYLLDRGSGLPPELMYLLADMHSADAASSGLDRSV